MNEVATVDTKGHSPRAGWQLIQKWHRRAKESQRDQGCSALVRTMRRALHPPPGSPPVKISYWRKAAFRAQDVAAFLSPEETVEFLSTLAEAKLAWRGHEKSEAGLHALATSAAEEMGSYSPDQRGEVASALARLGYMHEDFMQSLSRAVEYTVRAARGRMSNESACLLLDSYRRLGVLDEVALKSLSRLVCRRLVREPLTAAQTACVVRAYAELRHRDTLLFNAATLAFCRPGVVEELSFDHLADVALSYASLRLHSASLFARIRQRVCSSAGLDEDPADAAIGTEVQYTGALLVEQLMEQAPTLPPEQLPVRAAARFLEAQVHLEQLAVQDLTPLLPHLSHPGDARLPTNLATMLALALARGGHAWPWLWRRALGAAADVRLSAAAVLTLADALEMHMARLGPVLEMHSQRPEILQHLQVLAAGLLHVWAHLSRLSGGLPEEELRQASSLAERLREQQEPLLAAFEAMPGTASVTASTLRTAARRTARQFAGEFGKRCLAAPEALEKLLAGCQVPLESIQEDLQLLAKDSIHA